MKQKVNYISGPPGLGKTHKVLRLVMRDMLKNDGLVVYVAPTKVLLKQFASDLEEVWAQKHNAKEGSKEMTDFKMRVKGMWSNDLKPKAIADQVFHYFRHAQGKEASLNTFGHVPGSLLLLTHEGFSRLRPNSIPEKYKRKTYLYYDEARRVIAETRVGRIEDDSLRHILDSVVTTKNYEGTSFWQARLNRPIDEADAFVKAHIIGTAIHPSIVRNIRKLIEDIGNTSKEVYMGSETLTASRMFFSISLPAKQFSGYKAVTIMAAYFEDTQLHKMLQNDPDVNLVDITGTVDKKGVRRKALNKRYSKCVIVPLIDAKGMLSINALKQGIRAKQDEIDSIAKYLDGRKFQEEEMARLGLLLDTKFCNVDDTLDTEYHNLTTDALNISQLLNKSKVTREPTKWLLNMANKVIKAWEKKHPDIGTPLVFLNRLGLGPYSTHPISHRTQAVSLVSQGLNKYKAENVAVYLGAVNPSVYAAHFLKKRLPGYDPTKDYALSSCLQAISRISVRDTKATSSTLIVVPTMGLARQLQEAMYGIPKISNAFLRKYPDHNLYTYSTFCAALRKSTRREDTEVILYHKDPLNTLRKRMQYQQNHCSPGEHRDKVDKLFRRLEKLRIQRHEALSALRQTHVRQVKPDEMPPSFFEKVEKLRDKFDKLMEEKRNQEEEFDFIITINRASSKLAYFKKLEARGTLTIPEILYGEYGHIWYYETLKVIRRAHLKTDEKLAEKLARKAQARYLEYVKSVS